MPDRDADRDGILAGHGGGANERRPTLGVKGHNLEGRPPGKYSRPAPSPAAPEVPGRTARAMTRDVVAAAVVVILVGWAFYSTLGGHAEPKPGAAGVHDLTGMTNPHVTQQNIRSTMCRRGWDGLGGAVLDRRNLQLQRWSAACNAHHEGPARACAHHI